MRAGRRIAGAGIAAAALLLADANGGEPPVERTPPLPGLASPLLSVADVHRSTAGLEFSDLVQFDMSRSGKDWVLQCEMAREFVDGVFTQFETEWDCDGRRSDSEVKTRAAIGSRFRPTAYFPGSGQTAPVDLVRASWCSVFNERLPEPMSGPRVVMTNWDALATPRVGGARIEFRVPEELLDRRGVRGATTRPGFKLRATTTCSDHPVVFDYEVRDAGREIAVDGTVAEWSGGPYAEDGAGELHAAFRHLDVTSVWCENGPDELFVRVDFEQAGFGKTSRGDGDVSVDDALFVSVEPLGVAYMDPVLLRVPATQVSGSPRALGSAQAGAPGDPRPLYVCGHATVELSIPRKAEQTRLRVAVWTDGVRIDGLDGEWHDLPPRGGR